MSEINLDVFEANDVNSGVSAAVINGKDGRVYQKVALKPNTNYILSCYLKLKANNPLGISGYDLLGAYTTDKNDIISGDYPTNRISVNSTLLIQLSDLEETYKNYSFTFNSENSSEAIIGIFHCSRAVSNVLFVDDFKLSEEGSEENLLLNPSFENEEAWIYVEGFRKEI